MTRQYKDSGIEWIGQIPMDWKMQPLAIYFAENSKSNSDLGSVNALQFKYGEIIQKPNNGKELTDKDRELLEKYTVVSPDDIVVNGLNLNYDLKSLRIAKVREEGIITSAYIVLRPRNGANASFYNYYLKALDFQKIFHGMGVGIRLTLSYDELRSMLLAVPSFEEQQRIADYLDKKCAEIDGLIELQELMIAQLTDYKQSVITEAVTKGINPDAQLVPSGIDWIGDVPADWKVCKLKNAYKLLNGRAYLDPELLEDGKYRILRVGNLFSSDKWYYSDMELEENKYCDSGDLLYGWSASIGPYIWTEERVIYHYHIWKVLFGKNDLHYSYYLLQALTLAKQRDMHGSAMQHLTKINMDNSKIVIPPLSEQQAIAAYLDSKCSEIDNLITAKQQKIETLNEYKKSIIFECVTGKKEIN